MKHRFKILILTFVLLITSVTTNVFAAEGRDLTEILPGITVIDSGRLLDENGVEYTGGDIKPDEKFLLSYNWSIDDDIAKDIQSGDYFKFKLPNYLKVSGLTQGRLKKDDSTSYGEYTIEDGYVTLTFSDVIASGFNNKGEFYIGLELDPNAVIEPGEIEVEVPYAENSPYEFTVKPRQTFEMIDKKGKANKAKNPESITWDIVFNKNYDNLGMTEITDILPDGLILDSNTVIKVFDVTLDLNGDIVSQDKETDLSLYTVENNKIIFHQDVKRPYRIEVKSLITSLPEPGEKISYVNRALLQSENFDDIDTSATVVVETGKILVKDGSSYDPEKRTVSWTVKFNGDMRSLTNPTLIDRMDTKLELVEDTIKVVGDDSNKVYDISVFVQNGGFDLLINDQFSEPITITYTTKLKDDATITPQQTFNNQIEYDGTIINQGYGITQALFWKGNEGIDYESREAVWTWDINHAREIMNNAVIDDVFNSGGLEYIGNSFKIWESTSKDTYLRENIDYTLEVTETGLRVVLIGDYATHSGRLMAQYRTTYDVHASETTATHLKNTATLTYSNRNDELVKVSDYEDIKLNSETGKNGVKSGSYNAESKNITWTVALNYDRLSFQSGTFVDTLGDGEAYIPGSLKTYFYDVAKDGSIIVDESNDAAIDPRWIEVPSDSNDQTLTIQFPATESKKPYVIVFDTTLENTHIKETYTNNAQYTLDDRQYDLEASVSVNYGSELVEKDGVQKGDRFVWGLYINRSQSVLDNVVVTDTPSKNQLIDSESIIINGTTVDASGVVTRDETSILTLEEDYTVTYPNEGESFVIRFLNRIERPYFISYETLSMVTFDNRSISNDASITADGIEFEQMIIDSNKEFQAAYTGGTGSSVVGSYRVEKVDENNNPLEGVVFSLIFNKNPEFNYEVTTNAEGIALFNRLRMGDYTLKETEALPGYIVQEELSKGLMITVSEETSDTEYVHRITNQEFKVILEKKDSAGNALIGAQFNLEKFDGTQFVLDKSDLVANPNVVVGKLQHGKYRFVEKVANEGYIVNSQPIEFEVNGQETGDLVLDFTNYQGNVQLSKKNTLGQIIKDVTFDLYKEDTLFKTGLSTDDLGMIEVNNLQPGQYYFKEVHADGYVVNESPIYFEIGTEFAGEPEAVVVSSVNVQGQAILRKVNPSNNGISEVVFELSINKDGEYVSVGDFVSDADGYVRFENLVPGSYQVIEMMNPHGYIVDKTPIMFDIKTEATYGLDGTLGPVVSLDDVVNQRGSVIVEKKNTQGDLLDGAIFNLLDSEYNLVSKNLHTDHGILNISDLKPGNYYLQETTAPVGYVLSSDFYPFTIQETIEGAFVPQTIEIVNHKVPTEPNTPKTPALPATGVGESMLLQVGVVTLLIGFAILGVLKQRKRNV